MVYEALSLLIFTFKWWSLFTKTLSFAPIDWKLNCGFGPSSEALGVGTVAGNAEILVPEPK